MARALKFKAAVIGGGPAGCICAYFLQNICDVTVYEKNSPLKTLLPTGGGRCNLAYCEYDFKKLASNYPRGEKFLYSVFSRFSTSDTLDFFRSIGVETYAQEDMRIFPVSNSSKNVREKFLNALRHVHFRKETVLRINAEKRFEVNTYYESSFYDFVIIATGGHTSYEMCRILGHTIIEPKKALIGLKTEEDLHELAGVSLQISDENLLFTHEGISGPYTYKLSSLRARDKFPYKINIDLCGEIDLQSMLNANPHKNISNILAEILPKSLAVYILKHIEIDTCLKSCYINGTQRDNIVKACRNFTLTITGTAKGGEVVTAGGIKLDEVNPKTLESKLIKNLYFCGEVLDIDGFCGGFNLQNCWSTGATAAQSIKQKAADLKNTFV